MINIKSVSLKNFLSIGAVTQAIKLNEHGLSLILGSNGDANGGVTKNGAGKSTILQGISYGLYGQPLTKIKIPNLINNINQKAMCVVVEFERDGVDYRIERGKKPDILRFYKNGEEMKHDIVDNEAKGENRQTQEDIDHIVGMSHMMFRHIVALNTYTDPFLKLGAAQQRELIEELLGVTQISKRSEHLKQLIIATKNHITSLDAEVRATQAANVRITSAMELAQKNAEKWIRDQERAITVLAEELAAMEAIDFDAELLVFDELDRWRKSERILRADRQLVAGQVDGFVRDRKRLDSDLKRARVDKDGTSAANAIARLDRDVVRLTPKIVAIENSILDDDATIVRLTTALADPGSQECKTCGQTLNDTDHLDYVIGRMTEDLNKAKASKASKEAELFEVISDIAELQSEMETRKKDSEDAKVAATAALAGLAEEDVKLTALMAEKNDELARLDRDISALGAKPNALFESRDEVYLAKHAREKIVAEIEREQAAINPYSGQVAGLSESIQNIDMEPLNEAHDLLRHQDFLFKLLTSKDSFIRRKIVEQNLSYLNQRMSHYLNKLGLPHDVEFQSDLGVDIRMLGRDMDFAQLSRGEGNRVILAMSWAFRDVWESLNHRVNLLVLDELLDNGTDGHGAEQALQILKSFGRNGRHVFLISHRDELVGRIDHTLLVTKENGFTSISEA